MSLHALPARHGGVTRTDAVAQLRALHAITRASVEASNDDDLLLYTASAAQRALQAASVSIERFEREHGVLRTLVNVGDLGPNERSLPENETYAMKEYATFAFLDSGGRGVVTCLDDPDTEPVERELLRSLGKHSAVVVPILLDGAVWGDLYATRSKAMTPFDHTDLDFAEAVVAQVAAGIAQGAHSRRLEALVRLDPLTGLANRSAIEERLDRAIDQYLRRGQNLTVVICDVNGLKQVNDELGHDVGDRLLVRSGALLSQFAARLPGTLAGRLGGDEFALVVEGADTDEVLPVLHDLCQRALDVPHGSGLSCGVASTSDPIGHVGTPGDLLRLADRAQYRAKRSRAAGPVVAGRPLAPEVASVASGGAGAGGALRSPRAERRPADVAHAMVVEVVELLDGCRRASALDRLATVGATVVGTTDAAAWWVSVVPEWDDALHSLRYGASRPAQETGPRWRDYFELGAVMSLTDFPETDRVVQGGWSEHCLDDPADDPGELEVLRQGGYRGVVAAGGIRGGERWLLEIFTDDHCQAVSGLGPTLLALVALALAETR